MTPGTAGDDGPAPDRVFAEVADYVIEDTAWSDEAYDTARYCLMDALGCGLMALAHPECTKLLGPVVPGTVVPCGARVPGTGFELDPVQAAFGTGCALRWLDYNDTFLAAEWGHPSDNFGAILSVADHLSRRRTAEGRDPLSMRDVLDAAVKAYEIQGVLALENSFNRVGMDHVLLVRVASAAVATALLGGGRREVTNAVSNAFVDGGPLRVYRQAPDAGSRKSWAAGDATSRGVRLALMAVAGEMGYPTALSTERWGFQDAFFGGRPVVLPRPLGSYVVENVLFKVSFPVEFHAQTAVEAAVSLHEKVKGRLEEVEEVTITTQEPAVRIIAKEGPLRNPADRDHCLQYAVAVALISGGLTADHYEDGWARDPRIDALRERMRVVEDRCYNRDYLDPDKRSVANAVRIRFRDGSTTEKVEIEYPIGHRRRRREATPLLEKKFAESLRSRFGAEHSGEILDLCLDKERLERTPVDCFMRMLSA